MSHPYIGSVTAVFMCVNSLIGRVVSIYVKVSEPQMMWLIMNDDLEDG